MRLSRVRRGVSQAEYGLAIMLVALAIILIISFVGSRVTDIFGQAEDALTGGGPAGPPAAASVADFTVTTPEPLMAGQPIYFEATDPTATSWKWDFDASNGLGTDSIVQDPPWTYATPGERTVTLEAIGPGGTETTTQTITIAAGDPNVWEDPFNRTATAWNSAPTPYVWNSWFGGEGRSVDGDEGVIALVSSGAADSGALLYDPAHAADPPNYGDIMPAYPYEITTSFRFTGAVSPVYDFLRVRATRDQGDGTIRVFPSTGQAELSAGDVSVYSYVIPGTGSQYHARILVDATTVKLKIWRGTAGDEPAGWAAEGNIDVASYAILGFELLHNTTGATNFTTYVDYWRIEAVGINP